ncbi:MAG: thioredoxin-like domain-containing protein [Pyrinomonadaceae bacterium MAG19_C2-C3]|nr:thioredoxin-like domain-containing protein [Pyrinomonadaceae bacterium MAG19_C2-C3]
MSRSSYVVRYIMRCMVFCVAVCVVVLMIDVMSTQAQQGDVGSVSELERGAAMTEYRGRVRAPELTGGRSWLNTERPLTLQNLRGKIVLLDFWTYGCINCIHIIPDLKKLEAKYANQLVVIGVHSAKFDNEKDTDNIRRIVMRYEIEHPVANDADFKIWQAYAVNAWPTQMLIDPAGYVVGKVVGEGNYDVLDESIGKLVTDFRARGTLDEQPLTLALERAKTAPLPLAFPGKVATDERGDRLFIADSNHNRIVITKLDGTLVKTVGTGAQGRQDGVFDKATFYRPQGMAFDAVNDRLYVADTGNHLIRRLDFKTNTVTTIAGTGEQLRSRVAEGDAMKTALSSPWDVLLVKDKLYIAMAGTHQIWQVDLASNTARVFAGSLRWREARADGGLLESAFAQPSGLATDGRHLYVADSESNIIRQIDFKDEVAREEVSNTEANVDATPQVRTLAGGDLFEFGDRDGTGDDARFQHPLGVVFHDGKVLIADTYNHKIKQLNPTNGSATTFIGTGKPGQAGGERTSFYEPGGLSIARGKLYIADTNNHAIRTVDLKTRQSATLHIKNLSAPDTAFIAASTTDVASELTAANKNEIALPLQTISASDARLTVNVRLPEGYHLNALAPHRYTLAVTKGAELITLPDGKQTLTRSSKDLQLPISIPLKVTAAGAAELRVTTMLYYCREDNTGACRIKTLAWRVPIEIAKAGSGAAGSEIKIAGDIKVE